MSDCSCLAEGCTSCVTPTCSCMCSDIKYAQLILGKISENLKNRKNTDHDIFCPVVKHYDDKETLPFCCCNVIEEVRKNAISSIVDNGRESYTTWDFRS